MKFAIKPVRHYPPCVNFLVHFVIYALSLYLPNAQVNSFWLAVFEFMQWVPTETVKCRGYAVS